MLGNTQNSRHRYAASTSGNPSFSVLRQLQYLCELTQGRGKQLPLLCHIFLQLNPDMKREVP
ncbi:hypothetical protein KPHVMX_190151 [Klebsiella pneumoniae]|nr:hypothetical protein KPHVMX_190151 [Klebsiella pneumoniae]